MGGGKIRKKGKPPTKFAVSRWSPIQVLSRLNSAYLNQKKESFAPKLSAYLSNCEVVTPPSTEQAKQCLTSVSHFN